MFSNFNRTAHKTFNIKTTTLQKLVHVINKRLHTL